ncbi:MAG: hypothetical protein JKY65_34255 [Planctomycetes bacterium]|nr:hypothetical protein [Planctomycetota bacterium]
MRALLLSLVALSLLGCPDGAKDSTAAPARALTSALLPPKAQSLAPGAALTKPRVAPQTAVAGQGPLAPDDHSTPLAIGLFQAESAVLENPTDRDEFEIWLPVGYLLHAEVHSYGEVRLELLDDRGRLLADGTRGLSHSVAVSGTYTLRASAVSGQGLHYTIVTR